MRARGLGAVACVVLAGLAWTPSTRAQDSPPPPEASAPQLSQGQLDQLLAPIALYPDQLLGQMLMAAGFLPVASLRSGSEPMGASSAAAKAARSSASA